MDKKKILLIMLVSFVIIYSDFQFIIKMQLQAINAARPKIAKLKKDIDTLRRDLSSMQGLKSKQLKLKDEMLSGNKKIISEGQLPLLLENISSMANKNNVKIMQIRPNKELKKEGKNISAVKFTPVTINLQLLCAYHPLGKFINDLENADTFIAIEDLKITREQTGYLHQGVELQLLTYVKP